MPLSRPSPFTISMVAASMNGMQSHRILPSRAVHFWPPGGTNCRSSWQIGQDGGGSSDGVNWLPQVSQMKAGITRPDTLTRCALSSSAPPDATLVQRAACYGADSRRATPRPEICGRATAAHSGLRVAYLGGALVELAGGDDRARL